MSDFVESIMMALRWLDDQGLDLLSYLTMLPYIDFLRSGWVLRHPHSD